MKRRQCNKIMGLENAQGVRCTEPGQVDVIAVSYFQNLFFTCNPIRFMEITECVEARMSVEDSRRLMQLVTEKKVLHIMFQIPANKSSGPDGFIGSFFHEYWDVEAKDIVDMVQAFWFSGKLLWKLNHTHLVLISKVARPQTMAQLQPISLCNMAYKVIAKLLTKCMKMDMTYLICLNQSTFVAGR